MTILERIRQLRKKPKKSEQYLPISDSPATEPIVSDTFSGVNDEILGKGTLDSIAVPSDKSTELLTKMGNEVERLCEELSRQTQSFDKNDWLKKLDAYIAKYDRLMYASISNYVFNLTDEGFAVFTTNLDSVLEFAVGLDMSSPGKENTFSQTSMILLKFHDHANLAYRQAKLFSQKKQDLQEQIQKEIKPVLAESSKELTSQLIGLVAIFTALSFIVFGGITSLDNIMKALTSDHFSVLPVLIVALAWAFCLVNLLFAFMYFILRIIKVKLPSSAENRNLVQKYPLVFLCNFVLLFALMICISSWAAIQTGVGRKVYDYALKHGTCTFWLFISLFFAGMVGLAAWLWHLYKKPEIDYEIHSNSKE